MLNQLSYRKLQWLVAGGAALHNLEEAFTIPRYLNEIKQRLTGIAPTSWIATTEHPSWIYYGLVVVTIVPVAAVFAATATRPNWKKDWAVVFVQALFFVNVFIPHLPAVWLFNGYAPGLATAVFISLPYSLYFFRRTIREGVISRASVLLAIALAVPGLLLSLGFLHFIFARLS